MPSLITDSVDRSGKVELVEEEAVVTEPPSTLGCIVAKMAKACRERGINMKGVKIGQDLQ